jgi:hypothetical protein
MLAPPYALGQKGSKQPSQGNSMKSALRGTGAFAILQNLKQRFEAMLNLRRTMQNKLHSLTAILSMAMCAVLSGMDDWPLIQGIIRKLLRIEKEYMCLMAVN